MSIVEAHPLLLHYTTGAGLQGILESQALHATRMDHLNDSEEHVGFYQRRLPAIVREAVQLAMQDALFNAEGKSRIASMGGEERALETLASGMTNAMQRSSGSLGIPYVVCLCSPTAQRPDDGLLSQWRGYGTDGGYAVVLRTEGLDVLMRREMERYWYLYGHAGDVEYYDETTGREAPYQETVAAEAELRAAVRRFLLSGSPEDLEALPSPLEALACFHKHCGFREEREVRLAVAIGVRKQGALRELNDPRDYKPVKFRVRNGVPVPYISLFGEEVTGSKVKLPIERIIVGPHADRDHRREAVSSLLEEHGINAKVVVSATPFVSR